MKIQQSAQNKKPEDEGNGITSTIKQMFATGEFQIFSGEHAGRSRWAKLKDRKSLSRFKERNQFRS